MYICIDDTYGPEASSVSRYVTGARRSHVAVIFEDNEVDSVRNETNDLLKYFNSKGIEANEFHFTDIYNRRGAWKKAENFENFEAIELFSKMYAEKKWPVKIQTIDNRTFKDHGYNPPKIKVDSLDTSKRSDLSLFALIFIHIKPLIEDIPGEIRLILDEGRRKAGTKFGYRIFSDLKNRYSGSYESSKDEPLLQMADFIAFIINRSTHLSLKTDRSEMDYKFLRIIENIDINCSGIVKTTSEKNYSIDDFDKIHDLDRLSKGLPLLGL